ncbi:unnamed protein product [Ilex paraguariensis]|uniref:Uncharacterized protein n=1 Tax=Ilex paraguariensis TaxID=185542 RepID=A0ABC8QTJ6_9AQUA
MHADQITPPEKGPISSVIERQSFILSRVTRVDIPRPRTASLEPVDAPIPLTSRAMINQRMTRLEGRWRLFETLLARKALPVVPPPTSTSRPTSPETAKPATLAAPPTFVSEPREMV